MNSNLDRNNDPAQIKNQVIQDIKKVRDDINQIKKTLTPGQILDQLIFEQQSPVESLEYMVKNPIGTSFLTIGSLLLMKNEMNESYESKLMTKGKELKQQASDSILQTRTKIAQVKADFKSGIESKTENAQHFKEKVSDTFQSVKAKTHLAREAISDLDPMVLISLGAGLGVLTGYSVPTTSLESRYTYVLSDSGIDNFIDDLQVALNQSINLIKNEFFEDLSSKDINFF